MSAEERAKRRQFRQAAMRMVAAEHMREGHEREEFECEQLDREQQENELLARVQRELQQEKLRQLKPPPRIPPRIRKQDLAKVQRRMQEEREAARQIIDRRRQEQQNRAYARGDRARLNDPDCLNDSDVQIEIPRKVIDIPGEDYRIQYQ